MATVDINFENGRNICTPDNPMPKGAKGRWEHTNAHEVECGSDYYARYKCDDCCHDPNNGFHFADTVSAQERILREAQNDAIEQVAGTIQSALSELLEKAQTFKTCEYGGKGCAAYDKPLCRTCAIQKALEPWKPGE